MESRRSVESCEAADAEADVVEEEGQQEEEESQKERPIWAV